MFLPWSLICVCSSAYFGFALEWLHSAMPSYHDSLPSADLLSSWQTREALLRQSAQPQQERKQQFLTVFLCIPYRGRKEL